MSNPNDPYIEKTVIEQPGVVRTEYQSAPPANSNAGWWIAALVAVVAIVGLIFVFNNKSTSATDLQAAQDAGRSQAMMESATLQAQTAAQAATDAQANAASANAASSMAGATQAAAESARNAADRANQASRDAAASAQDAAQGPAEAPPPQ